MHYVFLFFFPSPLLFIFFFSLKGNPELYTGGDQCNQTLTNSTCYKTWGVFGNFIEIDVPTANGIHRITYCHMIKGSLNPTLLVGWPVKKGQFLGLVGNSGRSTGPHLHIHISNQFNKVNDKGDAVPFQFQNGYAIGRKFVQDNAPTSIEQLQALSWSRLYDHAIAGIAGERSYIYPGASPPDWHLNTLGRTFIGVFRRPTIKRTSFLLTNQAWSNFPQLQSAYALFDFHVVDIDTKPTADFYTAVVEKRSAGDVTHVVQPTYWEDFWSKTKEYNWTGYRIIDLEVASCEMGTRLGSWQCLYSGVYAQGDYDWVLEVGLEFSDILALWEQLGQEGWQLVDIEMFPGPTVPLYAGYWKHIGRNAAPGTEPQLLCWKQFTERYLALLDERYILMDVAAYKGPLLGCNTCGGCFVGIYDDGNVETGNTVPNQRAPFDPFQNSVEASTVQWDMFNHSLSTEEGAAASNDLVWNVAVGLRALDPYLNAVALYAHSLNGFLDMQKQLYEEGYILVDIDTY